jgi:hypothetical protein
MAGIKGRVSLRPYVFLTDRERESGKLGSRPQIVMQTSNLGAKYPMRNKLWPPERFQIVADALNKDFEIIQLGLLGDPLLNGATDLRGKTSVREAAAILASSHLFLGLVTGMMHLARAVDCRSVIIYGGREHPWQSGYGANENLFWIGACAPCWLRNDCDFERICMQEIMPKPGSLLLYSARLIYMVPHSRSTTLRFPISGFGTAPNRARDRTIISRLATFCSIQSWFR